jgi:hypothetical protein
MTSINDIGWSQYKLWEGPIFLGKHKYAPKENPDFLDKVLNVFTNVEGGTFDALNMYDKCIISLGLIQRCEIAPIYGTSEMIGNCAEINHDELNRALKLMPASPEFIKTKLGWRFYVNGVEINTKQLQQNMFLSTDGLKGSWNNESKLYAKQTASALCSVYDYEPFKKTQEEYAKSLLTKFVYKDAQDLIFSMESNDGYTGAMKAAYISFAGNSPTVANNCAREMKHNEIFDIMNDEDKCVSMIRSLVFDSEISIWPVRYDKIRKTIEKLFNVNLPDFSSELKQWNNNYKYGKTLHEVQAALDNLGYDIGPKGINGEFN